MTSKWDKRFMDMAKMVSTWSKDRGTGVGAVIVDDDKKVISIGFNGFPSGVQDDLDCRHESPEKHHWTIHAEKNAILQSNISIKGMTIYCTFFTCSACAQAITQKGIKRVVAPEPDWNDKRYGEGQKIAMQMYKEKGIEVSFYKEKADKIIAFWEIGCAGGDVIGLVSESLFDSFIDKYKARKIESGVDIYHYIVNKELDVIEFMVNGASSIYVHYGEYEVDSHVHSR